jgi:hypothetical protein
MSDDHESDSSSMDDDSDDEKNNKNNNGIINKDNNDYHPENNIIQNNIAYNNEKGTFREEEKSENSKEETTKKVYNKQTSTRKDLSINDNNNKSCGKMSETARFISNNGSSSDIFNSPAFKFKEREESSKLIKDDIKLNDSSLENKINDIIPEIKINDDYKNKDKNLSNNCIIDNTFRNTNTGSTSTNLNKNENSDNDIIIFNSLTIKGINDVTVSKYIDLSDKCGIGYILTNGDVGACFNDGTKMVRIKSTLNIVYINEKGEMSLNRMKKTINNPDYETKVNALLLFNKTFVKKNKTKSSF